MNAEMGIRFFNECVERVLDKEGYFSMDAVDLGNRERNFTLWGISSRYHPEVKEWFTLSKEESKARVKSIYYKDYWKPTAEKILGMSPTYKSSALKRLAYMVFDTAVQFDPTDANRMLQRACNQIDFDCDKLKVDGIIGRKTLSYLECILEADWIERLCWIYKSIRLYEHLMTIAAHPEQAVFAKGWADRTWEL